MRFSNTLKIISLTLLIIGCKETENPAVIPKTMLNWVTELIQNTPPEKNVYISNPSIVTWKGEAGAWEYACSTDCSGLLTALIKVTYKFNSTDLQTWLGSAHPDAETYHQAIERKNQFSRFSHISDIQQNMIISIKYPDSAAATGHLMLVASQPTEVTPTAPVIGATRQWVVRIADASQSPHSNDSRCDTCAGLGSGDIRLYTDTNGIVIGYSWSLAANAAMYRSSQHPIVLGKLTL